MAGRFPETPVRRQADTIDTALWRADELGAAMLLRGRFAGFAYDVHTHDTACFALLTRGAIRIRMRGGEFVARAGDLYAIDADEAHAGWPVDGEGWSQRTLYVGLDALSALVGDGAPRPAAPAGPIIRDPALAAAFLGVHRCSETGGPVLKREERYLQFAARLFARHVREAPRAGPGVGAEARPVRQAREFIDQRLDARLRLGEIAAAAGLPPFRLLRAFARAAGMSPHGYQRQARVRRAQALIRHGLPLGDAAAAAGFADQAHLTRAFRRIVGVTPGVYRAALAGRCEEGGRR